MVNDEGKAISLRPVRPEDAAFLLEVYASTRSDEMALVPWDAAQKEAFVRMQFTAQQQHYGSRYPHGVHDIILVDDCPVGRLYVAREAERIHILDITLLPQHRNAGTGTTILRSLMDEAALAGKAVSIHVETFNRSLRLFERLGFSRIEEIGFNYLMEWRPGAEGAAGAPSVPSAEGEPRLTHSSD